MGLRRKVTLNLKAPKSNTDYDQIPYIGFVDGKKDYDEVHDVLQVIKELKQSGPVAASPIKRTQTQASSAGLKRKVTLNLKAPKTNAEYAKIPYTGFVVPAPTLKRSQTTKVNLKRKVTLNMSLKAPRTNEEYNNIAYTGFVDDKKAYQRAITV